MSYISKIEKTYCKSTKLNIYHRKPALRLYIPFDVSTSLLLEKGEYKALYINDNDITNYSYIITNKKTLKKRFVINAYATKKYNLNTNTEYNICIKKEIPIPYLYRYELYFSYKEDEENFAEQRKFNVSFYSSALLDFETITNMVRDAIIDSLGDDYYDIVIGMNNGIAIARYLGYERVEAVDFDLLPTTEVNFPYIVIDLQQHYRPYNWGNFTTKMSKELLKYKSRLITLDYDDVDITYVEGKIYEISRMPIKDIIEHIELYQTTHGFHVYIYLTKEITFNEQIDIRTTLKDDEHRIEIDKYKYSIATTTDYYSLPAINTLFKQKWEYHKGKFTTISTETLLRIINIHELRKF